MKVPPHWRCCLPLSPSQYRAVVFPVHHGHQQRYTYSRACSFSFFYNFHFMSCLEMFPVFIWAAGARVGHTGTVPHDWLEPHRHWTADKRTDAPCCTFWWLQPSQKCFCCTLVPCHTSCWSQSHQGRCCQLWWLEWTFCWPSPHGGESSLRRWFQVPWRSLIPFGAPSSGRLVAASTWDSLRKHYFGV